LTIVLTGSSYVSISISGRKKKNKILPYQEEYYSLFCLYAYKWLHCGICVNSGAEDGQQDEVCCCGYAGNSFNFIFLERRGSNSRPFWGGHWSCQLNLRSLVSIPWPMLMTCFCFISDYSVRSKSINKEMPRLRFLVLVFSLGDFLRIYDVRLHLLFN